MPDEIKAKVTVPDLLTGTVGSVVLAVPHDLLDGSIHSDTLAGAVARGDIIIGNSTPKWARKALGVAGEFLVVSADGLDLIYRALLAADIPDLSGIYSLLAHAHAESDVTDLVADLSKSKYRLLGAAGSALSITGTEHFCPVGRASGATLDNITNGTRIIIPHAATIRNLIVVFSAAVDGTSRTITVCKQGNPTQLSVTVNAGDTWGMDTAHSFNTDAPAYPATAPSQLSIKSEFAGSPSATRRMVWAVEVIQL